MMKIAAGSYERFVWGWDADTASGELVQSFARPAHLGAIKCAAAWGGDFVTGGSDDTIHVFDLRSSRDIGSLQAHTGAITSLQFFAADSTSPKSTHLFSGSEDGTISIWDADSWIHLKSMKGKAPISDISVHPSGKLGVSVEKDGGFRMWNLMKGRCSFRSKLPRESTLVRFSGTGDLYALCSDTTVLIHNAEDAKALHKLVHEKPVLCMNFEDEVLFTAGEACGISAWDFRSGKLAYAIENCHSKRIKGIASLQPSHLIASASSDGLVKIWDTRMVRKASSSEPLMEADTKARLTCIVTAKVGRAIDGPQAKGSVEENGKSESTRASLAEGVPETNGAEQETDEDEDQPDVEDEDQPEAEAEAVPEQMVKIRKGTMKKNPANKLGVRGRKIDKKLQMRRSRPS